MKDDGDNMKKDQYLKQHSKEMVERAKRRKGFKEKTALTSEEKVAAAYAYYVRGWTQADIAIVMGGVNIGRVNEAIIAIGKAIA
jgi:hypothetical protein